MTLLSLICAQSVGIFAVLLLRHYFILVLWLQPFTLKTKFKDNLKMCVIFFVNDISQQNPSVLGVVKKVRHVFAQN